MKIPLPLLMSVTLLYGCATHTSFPPSDPQYYTAAMTSDDVMFYGTRIKEAIEVQIVDAAQWRGQRCTLRLDMARDGSLKKLTSESGNTEFCQTMLTAVNKAKLPPAPSDAVYQVFKDAPLDFAP